MYISKAFIIRYISSMATIKLPSQKHNYSPRRTIYFVGLKQNLLLVITKKIDKTQKMNEETCRVSFGRKITGDETLLVIAKVSKENSPHECKLFTRSKAARYVCIYISLSSYSPAIVMYLTHGRAWYPLFSMIFRYRTYKIHMPYSISLNL